MARRSRTSFKKRQKEIARMEKQRDKAAKRIQRKHADKESPESDTPATDDLEIGPDASTDASTPVVE